MPDFDVKEKRFEQDIEEYFTTYGGYQKGSPAAFNREKALTPAPFSPSSAPASPSNGNDLRKSTAPTVSDSSSTAFAGK